VIAGRLLQKPAREGGVRQRAGLFFAALYRSRTRAAGDDKTQPRLDDTFGFGVVFSDATERRCGADPRPRRRWVTRATAGTCLSKIPYRGEVLRSGRLLGAVAQTLLHARRCGDCGVRICLGREVDDPSALGADLDAGGRTAPWHRQRRERCAGPLPMSRRWTCRPNRFVSARTAAVPAFTFCFRHDAHGLAAGPPTSTAGHDLHRRGARETTWRRAANRPGGQTRLAFCERLFATELAGHRLLSNRSIWRSFPTVRNRRWHHGNLVLVGDAAHTAHFSVGSGTKLAMEDSVALVRALEAHARMPEALEAYEAARRPTVESLQRARRPRRGSRAERSPGSPDARSPHAQPAHHHEELRARPAAGARWTLVPERRGRTRAWLTSFAPLPPFRLR
jgi:anthraniloyl-CoA monooxygenase